MSKYAFIFIDGGVDYQTAPTPEQQAVYGEIFKWFEANAQRIADGGAELQPTRTATRRELEHGHVAADLFDAAERDHAQATGWQRGKITHRGLPLRSHVARLSFPP